MIRWQRILLVIAVPALIHGVPEATALQKSSRLSRPKKTVVRQSSQHLPFPSTRRFFRSPLSSATATITRTEEQQEQHKKQYQQAIQNVRERAKSGGSRHVPFEASLALDPTGGLVWSATCIGFIGLVFGLTKSGRLSPFFRCATSFLKNAFFAYRGALSARPLGTKVATGATLAILGDALAQSTSSTSTGAPYDKRRAASFAAFDSCYRVFQHFMFPAVIGLCGGDVVRHLLPPAFGPVAAAVERTLLYQLVIVPVSCACCRTSSPSRCVLSWFSSCPSPFASPYW